MPRVAAALLLALVASSSAGAAGHDVSTVRYAPTGLWVGPPKIAANGSRFLTVWRMDAEYPRPNLGYGAVTEPANGTSSAPFLLPGVTGTPSAIMPWGGGFISLWSSGDHFDIVTHLANGGVEHITHVAGLATLPRLASNGRQLLVVDRWPNDFSIESTLYASLYEPDGTLLTRTSLPATFATNFDVVRAGDSYVVVSGGEWGDVHFFRLDDAGTLIAARELQGLPARLAWRAPAVAVAGDSDHAVVAWSSRDSAFITDTSAYVTTVSRSNDVAVPQQLPRKFSWYTGLRVLRSAAGHLIIGDDSTGVAAVRADAAGRVIDDDAIPVANDYALNDAAAAGDQFAAIVSRYSDQSTLPLSLAIGTLLPKGVRTSLAPIVTTTAVRQEQPVIASDGVDYVAAWLEHEGSEVMARVGRVTRTGVPLDGAGVALPAPTKNVRNVSITRGAGGDALVVVSAAEGVWAFRWSRAVGLVDTAPILLERREPFSADSRATFYGSAAAWNGASYLVVWVDFYNQELVGRFVGSDGAAGAKFSIPMTLFKGEWVDARDPSIAWDGQQFLISIPTAYEAPCTSECPPPGAQEIRLVRLSAAGTLLDKTPYRILNAHSARVATSGSEFLLLLFDYNNFQAVVVHASASGLSVSAPVLPMVFSTAFDVIWDGSYYDIPWPGDGGWFHLWRLDRSGNLAQKLFTAVSTSPSYAPSVTANDAGEIAIGIAEEGLPSGLSRARIYFGAELESVQPVLTAPTNAASHLASPTIAYAYVQYSYIPGCYATVTWDGDAPGFRIEESNPPFPNWYLLQLVPGDVHAATVYTHVGAVIRIRAYGPDVITADGAITTIRSEPRTRTVRR